MYRTFRNLLGHNVMHKIYMPVLVIKYVVIEKVDIAGENYRLICFLMEPVSTKSKLFRNNPEQTETFFWWP